LNEIRKNAHLLRIQFHPDLVALWLASEGGDKAARSKVQHFLAHIVYRCDGAAQFGDTALALAKHSAEVKALALLHSRFQPSRSRLTLTYDNLVSYSKVMHFQQTAFPEGWYSLPAELLRTLVPLQERLDVVSGVAGIASCEGDDLEQLEADVVCHRFDTKESQSLVVAGDRLFIRVLHHHADSHKVIVWAECKCLLS
jgi:hypothetical protein